MGVSNHLNIFQLKNRPPSKEAVIGSNPIGLTKKE